MKTIYKKTVLVALSLLMIAQLGAQGEFARSLVFPGWGEMKMEEKGRAKIFMSTDLAIIASYFLGKSFNRWYIDRYTAFCVLHAGADMNGKDYAYIVNMANFDSMEDYNHDLMIHHNGNYFDDVYEDPSYDWNWDNSSNRNKFNDMRESSLIAEKIAEFAVAGLILNRVASAIDILYLKNKNTSLGLKAHLIPEKYDGVSLNVSFSIK